MKSIKKEHIALFMIFLIVFTAALAKLAYKPEDKNVRQAMFAGSWYPEENLDKVVGSLLESVRKLQLNGTVKAIIVPHAGYMYSGQVAATAFKQLDTDYETVFLLGPSHRYPLQGASILDVSHYETPLGEVKVSQKAEAMLREDLISTIPGAHANEHSLEIELPFLQSVIEDLEIVPILVGPMDPSALKGVLTRYVGEDDLVVVSVDLSHYHEYDEAKTLDSYSIQRILELDAENIFNAEIDAPWAVSTLILIAKEKSWTPHLVYYMNSGDVTGDKSSVVGYSSIIFVDDRLLSRKDQEFLLKLARDTIESYLKTGKSPTPEDVPSSLRDVQGCFTTLNKDSNLRGCIGHISPQEELYKCVMDNAISAAVDDRRFSPVTIDELDEIDIEISVLTVPRRLSFSSGEELKSKLRPGIDGVVLRQGHRSSTYLPQVWEKLADKEDFLTKLCLKGSMPADCWDDPSTEVYVYQAHVFEEP